MLSDHGPRKSKVQFCGWPSERPRVEGMLGRHGLRSPTTPSPYSASSASLSHIFLYNTLCLRGRRGKIPSQETVLWQSTAKPHRNRQPNSPTRGNSARRVAEAAYSPLSSNHSPLPGSSTQCNRRRIGRPMCSLWPIADDAVYTTVFLLPECK